jgi:uncharacterized membrane protein
MLGWFVLIGLGLALISIIIPPMMIIAAIFIVIAVGMTLWHEFRESRRIHKTLDVTPNKKPPE